MRKGTIGKKLLVILLSLCMLENVCTMAAGGTSAVYAQSAADEAGQSETASPEGGTGSEGTESVSAAEEAVTSAAETESETDKTATADTEAETETDKTVTADTEAETETDKMEIPAAETESEADKTIIADTEAESETVEIETPEAGTPDTESASDKKEISETEEAEEVSEETLNLQKSAPRRSARSLSNNGPAIERAVTDLRISAKIDGTENFDEDDEAGHDSGPENNILRTFDTLTYELRAAIQNPSSAGTPYGMRMMSNSQVAVYIRVLLPGIHTGDVIFLTDSMQWLNAAEVADTEEGLELTGYAYVDSSSDSATYWYDFTVLLKAYKMKQGEQFFPCFEAWLEDQEKAAVVTDEEGVTISAKVSLNASVDFSSLYKDDTYDFSLVETQNAAEGSVFGRMMGLGISFQLVSEHDDLKGVQLPEGKITLAVELKMSRRDNSQETDVTNTYTPLLWDYHQAYPGQGSAGYLGRNLVAEVFAQNELPYGKYAEECADQCVYDSGELVVRQEGNILYLTVENYAFSDDIIFPKSQIRGESIDAKRGYFSSVWMQVLMPYQKMDTDGTTLLAAQATGSGLTLDGATVTQAYEDDDHTEKLIETVAGSFYIGLGYARAQDYRLDDTGIYQSKEIYNSFVSGDFYAYPGEQLYLLGNAHNMFSEMNGLDFLIKVPEALQLTEDITQAEVFFASGTGMKMDNVTLFPRVEEPFTWKKWYAAKQDGQNWNDEEEMDNAQVDDLVFYESWEAAQNANAKVLGIYFEGRGGTNFTTMDMCCWFSIPVTVSEDAEVGYVYPANEEWTFYRLKQNSMPEGLGHGQGIRYRNSEEMQNKWARGYYQEILNGYVGSTNNLGFPARYVKGSAAGVVFDNMMQIGRLRYKKASYKNGEIEAESHISYAEFQKKEQAETKEAHIGDLAGTSLLIVGNEARIEKSIEQQSTDGRPRTVYDLTLGQRRVDFVLSPSYVFTGSYSAEGKTDTLIIEDTLSKGLTYLENSAMKGGDYNAETETLTGGTSFEPVITVNDEGCQVLTWTIEDAEAGAAIEKIHYSCVIGTEGNDETDVENNALLSNTVTIQMKDTPRALKESNSNVATASFIAIRSKSSSFFKTVDKNRAEGSDELCYTVVFENPSDTAADGLLFRDVLPFDEDDRGTQLLGGSYTVTKAEMQGGQDLTLYWTNEEDTREKMIAETDLSGWTLAEASTEDPKIWQINKKSDEITAMAWSASVPAGEKLTVKIHLKLNCPQAGAVLYNTAGVYTQDHQQLNTAKVKTEVVSRSISGTAWMDTNKNGKRDTGEKLLPGIAVSLLDEDGKPAADIFGRAVKTVITADDGSYLFEHLAEGIYQVVFTSDTTDISGWNVTIKQAADVDESVNSDAEGVYEDSVLLSAGIGGLQMLSLKEMENLGIYSNVMERLDAGFYDPKEPENTNPPDDPEKPGDTNPSDDPEKPGDTVAPENRKKPDSKDETETVGLAAVSQTGDAADSAVSNTEENAAAVSANTGDTAPIIMLIILVLLASGVIGYLLTKKECDNGKNAQK